MYDRDTLLVKVATMFYEEGQTQTNISKELGISRPTIALMLNEAREKNIVRIIITHPNKQLMEKEEILRANFPQTEIHIASQLNGNTNPKAAVGHTAAQLLLNLLENTSTIGVGWGTTLAEVIESLNYTNNSHLSIVPLIGGVVFSDTKYHSNYLTSEFANKTNGDANYLYAPAIAETIEIKNSFSESDMIQSVLSKAREVDIAIVGIGNPIVNSNYEQHGYLSPTDIKELKDNKVIGDILTSFFDKSGHIINTDISRRMIGLSIDDLVNVKSVLAVATGEEKALSTKAVLDKELLKYLVIDEALASKLIEIISLDTV